MLVTLKDGRTLESPELETSRPDMPPSFVISIRKAGSTMVTFAAQLIAEAARVGFLDIGSLLFYSNVPAPALHDDETLIDLIRPGGIYSGFRDYPSIFEKSSLFANGRKVIFLRDPRDALVSEYFSNAYSHDIPEGDGENDTNTALMSKLRSEALKRDVNEYVIERAPAWRATAVKFFPALHRPNTLVLRYEEMIFEKVMLVTQLCQHLQLPLPQEAIHRIAKRIDIRPAVENPRAFVRKVTPGDYKEKLSAETIAELNRMMKGVIGGFGYKL